MNLFFMLTGIIFWLIAVAIIGTWLISLLLEVINHRLSNTEARITKRTQHEVGSEMSKNAYWVSGEAFEDIHPYVLLEYIGDQIKDCGYFVWTMSKRQDILNKSKEYKKTYAKN